MKGQNEFLVTLSPVSAGFPSPADDFVENILDLNEYLIKHPAATFFVRVSIGISNGFFNLATQFAFKTSPNIGYVNIINTASITAITLLSTIFFKDKLTLEKIIGVIGVTLGLILLLLN